MIAPTFPQLTSRQNEVFNFIKATIASRGYAPSVRDIGRYFGIRSTNGVVCHLKALEKKGLISRECHIARAITVVDGLQHVCVEGLKELTANLVIVNRETGEIVGRVVNANTQLAAKKG